MKYDNQMKLSIMSKSINESFVRSCVAAFISQIDVTLEQLDDIKTAVSEAVTNAIVHGYGSQEGSVEIDCKLRGRTVIIEVVDYGQGIADIDKAMSPFFTTDDSGDRSGMGFAVMQAFCDNVEVISGSGITRVVLTKTCV